jgi:hypothetical protein
MLSSVMGFAQLKTLNRPAPAGAWQKRAATASLEEFTLP